VLLTTDLWGSLVVLVVVAGLGVRVGGLGSLGLEEVGVGDGREGSRLVNDRSLVDLLVDSLGVVDSGGLDSLTLDDRLDGLVDVVVLVSVDVLTHVSGGSLSLTDDLLVAVLGSLLVELGLVLWEHVLLVLSLDDRGGGLDVSGGEDLLVLDGLDSVLVVVDVLLTVDGLGGLDVLLGSDLLLNDLGGDLGADLGS